MLAILVLPAPASTAYWDVPGFDPSSRPRLAAAGHRASAGSGTVLVQIHDQLRAELARVRDAVVQVCDGAADPAVARSLINQMTMRQNYWSLGAFCAAYCRVLSVHHTIEDEHMFAELQTGDPALAPVLERLSEEHEVIAALLDRLDRALVALVTTADDAAAGEARTAVEALSEVLLSHLTYEEDELVGPLSRLGILV